MKQFKYPLNNELDWEGNARTVLCGETSDFSLALDFSCIVYNVTLGW